MNLIKSKSSIIALFFNGQLAHIINPWVLSVDYENETITVEKRNWYFIGINKNIIALYLASRALGVDLVKVVDDEN